MKPLLIKDVQMRYIKATRSHKPDQNIDWIRCQILGSCHNRYCCEIHVVIKLPHIHQLSQFLGRLATDHLRPSAFLMFTNANCEGDTFGESEESIVEFMNFDCAFQGEHLQQCHLVGRELCWASGSEASLGLSSETLIIDEDLYVDESLHLHNHALPLRPVGCPPAHRQLLLCRDLYFFLWSFLRCFFKTRKERTHAGFSFTIAY